MAAGDGALSRLSTEGLMCSIHVSSPRRLTPGATGDIKHAEIFH